MPLSPWRITRRTDVPSLVGLNSTSSTRARMRGMPRPRSNLRRSGSVTGGGSGSWPGSNPGPRSATQPSRASTPAMQRTTTVSSVPAASWASMAFVHASDTASFRSSMRSSARLLSAEARADTTSRARATNSARAGISSSMTPPASPGSATALRAGGAAGAAADRCVDGVVDREDLGEPGDLEDLQDAALGADQQQVAVVAAQPLEPPHQHAETGGVEEVDALEVDDDPVLALADELDQPLAE